MRDKTKYNLYINSQEWSNKRQEVFACKGYKCEACGISENLHVHHGTYIRLYKEKMSDLFVLCYHCHIKLHEKYGTKDLLRATKSFIKGIEYTPRKKKKRLPLEERKRRREERKALEIPKAIEAIRNGTRFKNSGVSSIKNWRKALKIIKSE